MKEIIEYIAANWVDWLFLAVTGMVACGYRILAKRQKDEAKKNKALADGVQALLRDRIIGAYNHYNDKGYCPIYAKESVRRLYAAYHALDGNDVATELQEKLLKMPTEEE